jgi:hypothetical protein
MAAPEDAARIAKIHMDAFESNAMPHAQLPTAEIREALQHSIEMNAHADILDLKTSVHVAIDDATASPEDHSVKEEDDGDLDAHEHGGKIIGFAKWSHPKDMAANYEEPPWTWPEGTAHDVLKDWTRVMEEAEHAAVGLEPCYSK